MPQELVTWGNSTWSVGDWGLPQRTADIAVMSKNLLSYDPTSTDERISNSLRFESTAGAVQFVNENGVTIDYTVEATYEGDDFTHAHVVGSGSLNSGSQSTPTTGVVSVSEPWDKVRVRVTPQTAPSSGPVLVAKLHVHE
jgi:hypothetical protein